MAQSKDADTTATFATIKSGRRGIENIPKTVWWDPAGAGDRPAVCLVDQTLLPLTCKILRCATSDEVCDAISRMALRGAPALGVGAAFALAIWSENESTDADVPSYLAHLSEVADKVGGVRPTAVNLSWGAHRVVEFACARASLELADLKREVVAFANSIRDADEASCRAIGEWGSGLFEAYQRDELHDGARIMTICNAGSLATAYYGTALGVIYSTFAKDRLAQVWSLETRPVNQGARLTSWELTTAGIPVALICDSAAGSVMASGYVDAVVVGADRICENGDFANKIGTYGLAVLAHAHRIPFYVAAPMTTVDLGCAAGDDIPIERRDTHEVRGVDIREVIVPGDEDEAALLGKLVESGPCTFSLESGDEMTLARAGAEPDGQSGENRFEVSAWCRRTPKDVLVYNPAFDVTPSALVTAYITDSGVFSAAELPAARRAFDTAG